MHNNALYMVSIYPGLTVLLTKSVWTTTNTSSSGLQMQGVKPQKRLDVTPYTVKQQSKNERGAAF